MKKILVLMLTMMLVAAAGACGSSEGGNSGNDSSGGPSEGRAAAKPEKPTAVETVQVAYRETAAERTAKTAFQVTTTGPPVDPENSSRPAPMTMTMTGEGALDFSGGASILSVQMDMMGTVEMRQLGNTVYMQLPEQLAAQMGGKRWVEVNLEQMYGQSGGGFDGMQGGMPSDPTRQLEYLRGVSDSVEKAGTEQVRGVRTTRYKATIDAEKEVANLDGEAREAYEDMLRQTGVREMPVEVWLDDQNRVRRYAMDVEMAQPDAPSGAPQGGEMRMQMVVEYHDFGTPLDVRPPPPNQTMDGRQLLQSQQQTTVQ